MASNLYNPSDSSTWKSRYTRDDLQKGEAGKIILPAILLLSFSLIGSIYVAFVSQNITNIARILILVILPLFLIIYFAIKYAFLQANVFVKKLYQLPKDYSTNQLIKHKLFIPRPLPRFLEKLDDFSFIILAKVEDLDEKHRARWFGGPARLIIYDGVAVYLERGNQFSRVLGPGFPLPVLEKHERIKAIVNLRPVVKIDTVKAWTKDGVKVEADVQAEIQILSSDEAKRQSVVLEEGQEATNLIYPFDPENVRMVVERVAVGMNADNPKELSEREWDGAAMGSITGGIKAHISRHSLNELITWDENSPQLLSFQTSNELFDGLEKNLKNNGVQLLDLQIIGFAPVDNEIKEKLEEYWEEKEKKAKIIRKGYADAQNIRIKQNAYTLTYQNFLNERINQLREVSRDNDNVDIDIENSTETAVMLFTQVFARSSSDPLQGALVAREMLRTLDMLRTQLNSRQNRD